jgi:ABC-type branched-subunit amino acid transport system substrate-binding protein
VKKLGWNVDLLGEVASYDTAIAEAPGNVAEGFFSMAPSLYAYPDDSRPAGKAFMQKYKAKYGVEANYLGQMGYTSAPIAIQALLLLVEPTEPFLETVRLGALGYENVERERFYPFGNQNS